MTIDHYTSNATYKEISHVTQNYINCNKVSFSLFSVQKFFFNVIF